MQNLNRLMNSEGKTYHIGPIPIRKGIPQRAPYYFILFIFLMLGLDKIPLLPFYWFYDLSSVIGFCLNYLFIPVMATAILTTTKKDGKKPEKYLLALWSYYRAAKRISYYSEIKAPMIYQYRSVVTYRKEPRRLPELYEMLRRFLTRKDGEGGES